MVDRMASSFYNFVNTERLILVCLLNNCFYKKNKKLFHFSVELVLVHTIRLFVFCCDIVAVHFFVKETLLVYCTVSILLNSKLILGIQ